MKVLHLSSEKSWRGGEQQISYLIGELDKRGIKNFVACRKGSPFEDFCRENHIAYRAFSFRNQFDFSTILGIKKYCKENEIDLIHMHAPSSHGAGVLSHLFGNKVPLVLSRRVDFPVKRSLFSRFKYNYEGIEKIICVSEKIKKITSEAIQDKKKVTTVHSGIDLDKFSQANNTLSLREKYHIKKEELIIGQIAALAPHKGYYTFIDTAELLLKQGLKAKFFIIGDGASKASIEKYIAEKNLQEHFVLTGFLNNIPTILPQLDIFMLTSEMEGLGTSILDAMACRVPVVTTRAGGIPEIVLDEKTGLTAEVKDAKGLANQVFRLARDPELIRRLVENAHDNLKYFTKEYTASQTLKIYQEVI
ncbi:glycosyltransferase family 4 protein [Xanthovirga aplysinae]|uniref:glycosyltransferase family 4 protein n=1 Tax=Xanthovirga aplysinae TaxID=2529853 RepID=UPI0012BD4467|nr:glycosyltransferase family 4 protein [Xanthovirga aplysinae]MTI33088.1 glycosyltransferase family 1 protein [Xanthovirga aplysinae]